MQPHAHRERGQAVALELAVVLEQLLAHGQRRAHGVVGLPRVRLQRAEHGEHAVADERGHVAAVVGDGPAHALEVAVQDPHEDGRVEALAERRVAHQVGEERGDLLAFARRRHAAGDHALDDLLGGEAAERLLQALQVRRGTLEPLAQDGELRAPPHEQRGQERDHQRRAAQEKPGRGHQLSQSARDSRPIEFAWPTTPMSSRNSSTASSGRSLRALRWMSVAR